MPVHDLKCNDCGEISATFINLKDKQNLKCNKCGSKKCHIYYGNFGSNNFSGITYYTDISDYGKKITAREIDAKCKREKLVYGSPDEISRAASKYRYQKKKESEKRDGIVADKIVKVFKDRGLA